VLLQSISKGLKMHKKNTIFAFMFAFTSLHAKDAMIIGHRGAAAYMPENTISSFKEAIRQGVNVIELDIRKCASGELIVIHDDNVNRVTNGRGYVREKTLTELKQLTLKNNETLITLEEALACIDKKVAVALDLKEEGVAELVTDVVKRFMHDHSWSYEHFFATGFEHRELKKLKALLPDMRLVPAIVGTPHNLTHSVDELDPYGICLLDLVWSPAVLANAKNRDLKVWVCTMANESKEALERWVLAGVDALMVNAPDKGKQMIQTIANYYRFLFFLDLDPSKELNTPHISAFKSDNKIPYGNRAVIAHDTTTDDIAILNDFYKNKQYAILLAPHQQQAQTEALLKAHGYTYDGLYPLMTRDLTNLPAIAYDPHISIKEITSLADIETLWVSIFSEAFKKDAEQIKLFVRYLTSTAQAKTIHFYVGFWDETPAAVGIAIERDNVASLHCLATHPEFRHKGLGSACLHYRMNHMKEKGFQKAIALVSAMGKPLHEKVGAQETAVCTIYCSPK